MTQRKVRPPANFIARDRPFQTRQELDAYLNADKIVCLMCGLSFTRLPPHLKRKHDLTADDYKIRFGIPFRYGLTTPDDRTASSQRMKAMHLEGKIGAPEKEDFQARVYGLSRRARAPFLSGEDIQKLIDVREGRPLWTRSHYGEFIRRVAGGRQAASVGRDADLPSRMAFMRYLARNEDLRRQYEAVLAQMPLSFQIQARKAGTAWRQTVASLRAEGLSWPEIAAKTGLKVAYLRNLGQAGKRRTKRAEIAGIVTNIND